MSTSILRRFNKWLAGRIFERLKRTVADTRPPDFTIGNDPNNLYMRRWWAVPRNRFFNIYLHHILRDDEDRALHDHPWASLSLCLSGHVGEVYKSSARELSRVARQGDWVYRSSRFAHRLFLPSGPAWTLFMTGPRVRTWGFHCPKESPAGGWRPWYEFTAVRDLGPRGEGHIGRGCD